MIDSCCYYAAGPESVSNARAANLADKGSFEKEMASLGLPPLKCYVKVESGSSDSCSKYYTGDFRVFNDNAENPLCFKKYVYLKDNQQHNQQPQQIHFELTGNKVELVFKRVHESSKRFKNPTEKLYDVTSIVAPIFKSFGLFPPKCFAESSLDSHEEGQFLSYKGKLFCEFHEDYKYLYFENLIYQKEEDKEVLTMQWDNESIQIEKKFL